MKIKTQPNNYSCGIYAIINALIAFGDNKSPAEIQEYTNTTYRNGTSEKGIKNALNEFGYKTKEYKTQNKDNAWRWVLNNSINYPLILYLNTDHWAVIAGRIKNRVILIDSYDNPSIDNKEELLEKWYNIWYWGLKVK